MISSPESNVQLSNEDAAKLELASNRLAVVQQEVLRATKQAAALEEQVLTSTKARNYAEEQRITVEAQVAALQKQRMELQLEVANAESEVLSHRSESKEIHATHTSRAEALSSREATVLEAEKSYAEKALALEIKSKQLEADRAQVENARNAFLDAIAAVAWR